MPSRTRLVALLVALAVLGVAASAGACPVCFDAGNPNVGETYRRSTLFLTLLPFGVVGAIAAVAVYLARRPDPASDAPAVTPR
jgi:hypothetical protein